MLEKISNDMMNALKNKEMLKLATLRMLKGAIDLERINKKHELNDEEIISIIEKQIKIRKESIIDFEKGNRTDLIDKTNEEINVLNSYMPEKLSDEEVISIIEKAINDIGANNISDMGKVMKEVSSQLRGKADMSYVSSIIKEKLN